MTQRELEKITVTASMPPRHRANGTWPTIMITALLLPLSCAHAATITVNSTSDAAGNDGVCTLREAITASNLNVASGALPGECGAGDVGGDAISFAIPGAGVRTITPASALPPVVEPVFINGFTQSGASPNSNPLNAGINAVLLIEINQSTSTFTINADGTTIRGLVFNRGGDAITVNANNVFIAGNFIGTDPTGTLAPPSFGGFGIRHRSGLNNIYGGISTADRNLISGNLLGGIIVENGDVNRIEGNYIGTDAQGSSALSTASSTNQIGITILGGGGFVTANTAIVGNLISGNRGGGIDISSFGGSRIQGNLIGTQRDGVSALSNLNFGGINVRGNGVLVGGTSPGLGNTIAFNQLAAGLAVASNRSGNAILGNSIFSNQGLGIALTSGIGSPLPNDPCDLDSGVGQGNLGQNYPVITAAPIAAGNVVLSGTLNSTLNTTFRLEFFANAVADPSGNGEGQTFIGTVDVTTNAGCNASFGPLTLPVPAGQSIFTATATDPGGNTSEYSLAFPVGGPSTLPPSIAKSFGAASIALNGSTALSFTINNPNLGSALNGIAFTDNLPAGLIVATPNGLLGTCGGGTIVATAGSAAINLSGATLAASTACTFSVNLTATTVGVKNNVTGTVSATQQGVTGNTASASLTVIAGAPPGAASPIPALNPWALLLLGLLLAGLAAVRMR